MACSNQVIPVGGLSAAVLALNRATWNFEFEMNDVPRRRRREVYRKLVLIEPFWLKYLNAKLNSKTSKSNRTK